MLWSLMVAASVNAWVSKIVRVEVCFESKSDNAGKLARNESIKRLIDWKAAANAWNSLSVRLGDHWPDICAARWNKMAALTFMVIVELSPCVLCSGFPRKFLTVELPRTPAGNGPCRSKVHQFITSAANQTDLQITTDIQRPRSVELRTRGFKGPTNAWRRL